MGAQLLEALAGQLFFLDPAPDQAEQMGRRDAARPQGPEPFDDDGHGHHGTQNNRQHDPAACFDQLPHGGDPLQKSGSL
ncbi:hypothetical protein D3C77_649780 [compost metagenome]